MVLCLCSHAAAEDYDKALKEPYVPLPDPGVCANLHEMCETWAKQGECKNNPGARALYASHLAALRWGHCALPVGLLHTPFAIVCHAPLQDT
jgi:hypothetical protein